MNLKKCTSLFIACLLLLSNIGLAFSVHYCGGKIASVTSVFTDKEVCEMQPVKVEKNCCHKKIESEDKKCCKNKVVNFDDKSDDSIVKNFSFQIDALFLVPTWKPSITNAVEIQQKAIVLEYVADANAPPLFKLYSQYILYA